MRRSLAVLAVGALAGATLLVPSAASAQSRSYWATAHPQSRVHPQLTDSGNSITWTILDHKIVITTPTQLMVPFVYTCGSKADPQPVKYDPAAFQTVYAGFTAAAFTDVGATTALPTFTCDGTQHITDVVLSGALGAGFEKGNIEVGLIKADAGSSVEPTFEHATVGYDQLHDSRAPVAVTVDATPETTKAGAVITVKGTVKRNGKAYKGKAATLYFQARVGTAAAEVGKAVASSKGKLTTTVTVTGPGTYFWTTASTSKTQAGASDGDYAAAS